MGKIIKFDRKKKKKTPEPPLTKKVKKYGEFDSWLEETRPAERFPQFNPNFDNGLRGITELD